MHVFACILVCRYAFFPNCFEIFFPHKLQYFNISEALYLNTIAISNCLLKTTEVKLLTKTLKCLVWVELTVVLSDEEIIKDILLSYLGVD